MIVRPTTKFLLAESFKELSQKKAVDKITIKEIAKKCGLTAQTFYNHFRDKYDLIAWIMNKIDFDGYSWKDSLKDGIRYFFTNREFLKNLIVHTSGQDSFINYVAQFNVKILSGHIKRSQKIENLPQSIEIAVKVYCYGTVCTICEFLVNPTKISAEEFANLLESALPECLKKYLY